MIITVQREDTLMYEDLVEDWEKNVDIIDTENAHINADAWLLKVIWSAYYGRISPWEIDALYGMFDELEKWYA